MRRLRRNDDCETLYEAGVVDEVHLFSLRIGTFSTERGMGQFISAAAFKLRQSFSTSTDFIRIGSRVFIFDRRQWISAGAFNFGMDIQ